MSQKLVIPCFTSVGGTRNLTINNSDTATNITAEKINTAMNPIFESRACYLTSSGQGYISAIKGDPYVEVTTRNDISMS